MTVPNIKKLAKGEKLCYNFIHVNNELRRIIFVMEFGEDLQEKILREERDLQVKERVVDISSTDIVRLNQCINQMIDDDKLMLESSQINAARFACSK